MSILGLSGFRFISEKIMNKRHIRASTKSKKQHIEADQHNNGYKNALSKPTHNLLLH